MVKSRMWKSLAGALAAALGVSAAAPAAQAFDLEDYATTFRATRDALFKAANQTRLVHGVWVMIKEHAALHGIDVRDEDWLMTPGLVTASCEAPADVAFGTNLVGPAMGHAFGQFIRQLADVVSPQAFTMVLGDTDAAMAWYRQQRDEWHHATLEAVLAASPPGPGLPSMCLGATYYTDIEDLMTTIRAYRDAYLKAMNEYQLAIPPYKAALAAYTAATDVYTYGINCDPGPAWTGALPKP